MIEKNPYGAPTSIEDDIATMPIAELEIEVVVVPDEEMGEEITLDGEEGDIDLAGLPFTANLAEHLEEGLIDELSSDLLSVIANDLASRKDWEETYKDGVRLLGLKYEERSEPWEGACGVFHPMITEAVVRFQSETIMETLPAMGPVRVNVIGEATQQKMDAATRVREDLNHQIMDVMVEFRPEHERMLWNLPATGSAFKKVYYDAALGRQTSRFVPAEDVIVPYGMTDINTTERLTHRMRKTENELVKLQKTGFYSDIDIGDPTSTVGDIQKAKDTETGFSADNDNRYEVYEVHADLLIEGLDDGDGVAVPYVVTLIKDTGTVLAIYRNWRQEDPLRRKRDHFVHYVYIPGYGAYGFGLFHLIGGFARGATSLMRQLVDAGTLSNLPGGFKTRGMRVKGDDTPISPGEFRDVDVPSGTIEQNIMALPYKEPSQTLYNLLNTIVEEGRRFAATADLKISDMSANTPVGTTLAILERMLKVMTAVQARVHYALKQEFRLIAGIIRDYAAEEYDHDVVNNVRRARKTDFSYVDIIPVSDPNAATMSQRVVQFQAVIQMAERAPQLYNQPLLHRTMLEVMQIKNADKLVPLPEDMKPKDPVSENMGLLKMQPTKAFLYQDHQAHITAHMALLQDPSIAAMIGQNPQAQAMQAALMAHVSEHVAYAYRQRIEKQMGVTLPPPDMQMPEQLEVEMSRMVAEVAPQLVQQAQQQAAMQAQQQVAQQAAQDPLVQMQMQELQIKGADLQRKQQKDQQDAMLKDAEIKQRDRDSERDFQADLARVQAQIRADAMRQGRDGG